VHETIGAYGIMTGDPVLDRSVGWSAAMLAANRHYIDGIIVPMPCPAEYNFYFTHDVLLTDLGAVHYDRERVKRDLAYITSLARDTVIPHAYYWRDDGMKTEFCPPDNWNHLWFILASASYIRHAQDDSAAAQLFPFVKKSLTMILTQRRNDGLLYAKHPDWWDIGSVDGPRAYITALTVRAIGEYCALASRLGESDAGALRRLEQTADAMKTMLVEKLWDSQLNYLINYNGQDKDRHIYAGSLVAGAYGVLDNDRNLRMAETARRAIVDSRLGVRTVSPTDFNTDSVIAYFHLAGNEAGAPFVYANGGIWPHTTSWYIWVLNAAGKKDEAAAFLKTTLSIDGIMASPMGQPAMYEYRFADPASPRYGEIDKPTFMWAAGFFLQSLYRIYGISDNEWNISIGLRPESGAGATSRFPFVFGKTQGNAASNMVIVMSGSGACIQSVRIGGRLIPSAVIPLDASGDSISVGYGSCTSPYLESVNAIVHSAEEIQGGIAVTLSSFEGHTTKARFLCVRPPKRILIDGRAVRSSNRKDRRGVVVDVAFRARTGRQTVQLKF
ncbi:MAG TPA: amylo-alpha-1,6-glucosidase, partial [Bacteroidota bacterium]|nr:amylo-alpha-1,6-glucosidase [Bacteroidota bacterium]